MVKKKGCKDMAYIGFNLNEMMKVKLNNKGKDIYYHRNDMLGEEFLEKYPREYPDVDEEGYTVFQAWEFMNLYGSHLKNGGELPISSANIKILVNDE